MNEITLTKPTSRLHWLGLHLIYLRSFPAAERKPFSRIKSMYRQGRADVWCIRRNGRILGFAATVNGPGLVLLDYLAVAKGCRGTGIGSAAMAKLQKQYKNVGFFVEIESTYEAAKNWEERLRRKRFYEKAGLVPMGTEADAFGVRMELLGSRCHLTFAEYRNFYRDHYSPWAAEHIKEV